MNQLLERALDRLKLINGDDSKCVIHPSVCPNHALIKEIEAYLAK